MTTRLKFPALVPDQARNAKVAFFISTAGEIARIARIDRLSRTEDGTPSGFQRPQISGHIREFDDYLACPDSFLATPTVLGSVGGATITPSKPVPRILTVDLSTCAPCWILTGLHLFLVLILLVLIDYLVII